MEGYKSRIHAKNMCDAILLNLATEYDRLFSLRSKKKLNEKEITELSQRENNIQAFRNAILECVPDSMNGEEVVFGSKTYKIVENKKNKKQSWQDKYN